MYDRLQSAAIALTLAVLVWLYARSRDLESLDNIPIPVEMQLADGLEVQYDVEVAGPTEVAVSFHGPPSRMRDLRGMLQRGEVRAVHAVAVPEERRKDSPYTESARIDAADVHAAAGVSVSVVEGRNRVSVTLHRIVERLMPVRLDPRPEEAGSRVTLEPATVRVRGPQDILDRVRSVPTQVFPEPPTNQRQTGKETMVAGTVPIVRELHGRRISTIPSEVAVRVTLPPKEKLYEMTDVPIQFLCPAEFPLRPQFVHPESAKVNLKFWAPPSDGPPTVMVFIDLTSRELEPGLFADEPLRLQLPKDSRLAQNPPAPVPFRLLGQEPGIRNQESGVDSRR